MKSFTSRRFRDAYAKLPEDIRRQARRSYESFRKDPSHPGLQFKKLDGHENMYSIRVGLGYRALGQIEGSDMVWFWMAHIPSTIG